MDGQEVVGRLNARALLTSTERSSLNCGSAPAPCRARRSREIQRSARHQELSGVHRASRWLARPSRVSSSSPLRGSPQSFHAAPAFASAGSYSPDFRDRAIFVEILRLDLLGKLTVAERRISV